MLSVQGNWQSFKAWILFIIRYGQEEETWNPRADNSD
jgi:hypothetical protein